MAEDASRRVGIVGGIGECDHAADELLSVGTDGLNEYLTCRSCGGVLVVSEGVVDAVRSKRQSDSRS